MDEIGVIARIILRRSDVLATLGVSILVLAPAAMLAARRVRWSRARVVCAGVSGAGLALVPATTLARGDASFGWGRCLMDPALSLRTPEALLNALLFAPAAFFAVLAVRRAAPVVWSVIACSVAVEVIQSVTGVGTCQAADMVRNVAGATVACAGGALLIRLFARPSPEPEPASPR